MAQPYLDELSALVDRLEIAATDLNCRHFFSGAASYHENRICASLTPKGLAFKLPQARCAELFMHDAVPLRYFDKSPVKAGYALFPDYRQMDETRLAALFRECLDHAAGG